MLMELIHPIAGILLIVGLVAIGLRTRRAVRINLGQVDGATLVYWDSRMYRGRG